MSKFYSDEKNVQILISLLKEHGIKYIVASPGTTNHTLVISLQHDPFFTIYSSVDERSAAYIACGIASETGEPVVLSCTHATASRNYMSGLTEAYYRKLPILAITSCRNNAEIGHLIPQVIDRRTLPNDIARLSVSLPIVKDDQDEWECNLKINQAILELRRGTGGPVHIDMPSIYCTTYNTKELPKQRVINRYFSGEALPLLNGKKIAIFVGAHKKWSEQLTRSVDLFCERYNSIVICDHTSAYHGKYRIQYSLIGGQEQIVDDLNQIDVLIHLGEVSGDYFSSIGKWAMSEVWRVSVDGEVRDTFRKLRYVFEMDEATFFTYYNGISEEKAIDTSYYNKCRDKYKELKNIWLSCIDNVPFSNIWIASQLSDKFPSNSAVHISILNSLRSWNFFEFPDGVESFCNVGGFGIDGTMSALIGASLVNPQKLYFGIIGDLSYFYDLNSLGNRHIGNNIRILLINNGIGTEFKLCCYPWSKLGEDSSPYMAAEGHFGHKSPDLVKHYVQDLGLEYMSASTKEELLRNSERFFSPHITGKSMLMEVFISYPDESIALDIIRNLDKNVLGVLKKTAKSVLNADARRTIRKFLGQ